ncbi:5-formyltetrahydrofolate cyclo-ligase [Lactovum odontotermitis]
MNNFFKQKLLFYVIIIIVKNKVEIREEILLKLRNFAQNEKSAQTLNVLSEFISSQNFIRAQSIGLYMNTLLEFNLSELFNECLVTNKKIFIPQTLPHREMTFIELEGAPENWRGQLESKRGILEPRSGNPGIPDLIVVPGLAWNSEGFRIGFGGGYYDRYLADFKGHTVSLVYDFQRVEFSPEAHDVAVKEIFSV